MSEPKIDSQSEPKKSNTGWLQKAWANVVHFIGAPLEKCAETDLNKLRWSMWRINWWSRFTKKNPRNCAYAYFRLKSFVENNELQYGDYLVEIENARYSFDDLYGIVRAMRKTHSPTEKQTKEAAESLQKSAEIIIRKLEEIHETLAQQPKTSGGQKALDADELKRSLTALKDSINKSSQELIQDCLNEIIGRLPKS